MALSPLTNATARKSEELSIDLKSWIIMHLISVKIVSTRQVWAHLDLSVYIISENQIKSVA